MPTVGENREAWGLHYAWSQAGDEWSEAWGGTEALWWATLFPRLRGFFPAGTVLEIGPGYGRITHYLARFARQLVLVDLAERCLEACRERFRDLAHLSFHLTSGASLAMLPDRSVDFVFSWDSLVHAEADVMEAYVRELARVLTPAGAAFLHHSNLGAFADGRGELTIPNAHWRAASMSADLMLSFARGSGLSCPSQELVNWGGEHLIDCFSTLAQPGSTYDRAHQRWKNPHFMDEAQRVSQLAAIYGLEAASSRKLDRI